MELDFFWRIFLSITIIIAGISFISVNVKKVIEKLKELKIHQNVTVMPISNIENNENSSRSELAQMMQCFGLRLNNAKHNEPMFTGKQMASLIISSFSMILAVIIFRDLVPIVNPHKAFVYQVIIVEPVFLKILIPIAYLMIKKDFRRFFYMNVKILYYNMITVLQFVKNMICFNLKEEKGASNEYLEDDEQPENPKDVKEVSDNEGSNYSNTFFKATTHSNEHPENVEDVKEVSDDKATTHSNLQVDIPTENSRKFKCSYDCHFSTFSIEEYMEHFQTMHLYENLDPKAICPSNCCPSSSTGCCKYQTETSKL